MTVMVLGERFSELQSTGPTAHDRTTAVEFWDRL